jgi:uncharacterized protein YeaO (DUF488 family)
MIRTCSINTVWKVPLGMRKIGITVGRMNIELDDTASELAPTWDMVNLVKKRNKEPFREEYGDEYIANNTCEEIYTRAYREKILSKLDAGEFLNKYGRNICLICFCSKGTFCHRLIVAKWLQEYMGELVTEL